MSDRSSKDPGKPRLHLVHGKRGKRKEFRPEEPVKEPENPFLAFAEANPEQAKRIEELIAQGRTHLEASRLREARRAFIQARSIFPHVPAALNNLAVLALHDGNLDQARDILEQALMHFPDEPISHALVSDYFLEMQSHPLATLHATKSLGIVLQAIQQQDREGVQRAILFVGRTLAKLQDDVALGELYRAAPDYAWDRKLFTQIGIALFNRGYIEEATALWNRINREHDFQPAGALAAFGQRIAQGEHLPFHLDYNIQPKVARDEEHGIATIPLSEFGTFMGVLSVNAAFDGSPEEAKVGLSTLAQLSWPAVSTILLAVALDGDRPTEIRILSGLYLVWLEYHDEAERVADQFDDDELTDMEQAPYFLLRGYLAQAAGDLDTARHYAELGLETETVDDDDRLKQALHQLHELIDEDDDETSSPDD